MTNKLILSRISQDVGSRGPVLSVDLVHYSVSLPLPLPQATSQSMSLSLSMSDTLTAPVSVNESGIMDYNPSHSHSLNAPQFLHTANTSLAVHSNLRTSFSGTKSAYTTTGKYLNCPLCFLFHSLFFLFSLFPLFSSLLSSRTLFIISYSSLFISSPLLSSHLPLFTFSLQLTSISNSIT